MLNKPNESLDSSGGAGASHQLSNSTASTSIDRNTTTSSSRYPSSSDVYVADSTYQNSSTYSNRETMLCDGNFSSPPVAMPQTATAAAASALPSPPSASSTDYYNFTAIASSEATKIERTQSMKTNGTPVAVDNVSATMAGQHNRSQSLVLNQAGRPSSSSSLLQRKIPENLDLTEHTMDKHAPEPSPALSTSSGPYIPISECFSGSPIFLDSDNPPATPLNSLDPRFYDMPRAHNNIGLNLTSEQQYSPKRNNFTSVCCIFVAI